MEEKYFQDSEGKKVKIIEDELDDLDGVALDRLMGPYRGIKPLDHEGKPFVDSDAEDLKTSES